MFPRPKRLLAAAVRAVRRMVREHFTGTAAELSYYALLSAVPCIAAFVGVLGLLGSDPQTTEAIADVVREGASPAAGEVARDAARQVVEDNGGAGVALGAGLLTTLWVASLYLAAFRRAAHRVHGADSGPAWRVRPLQMALTFLGLVVLAIVSMALVITERLIREIGQAMGAEEVTVAIWSLCRWPLTLMLVVVVTAGLYNLAPRPHGRRLRLLSVGPLAAVIMWMVTSIGFEVWVGRFAEYDATYGALAGTIAFVIWLWISNLALLFGLVLDLDLDRGAAADQKAQATRPARVA